MCEGAYGVHGGDILLVGDVPLENLRVASVKIDIFCKSVGGRTLVPNLVSSFDAPTTAYLGEDKKAFFCSSVPGMLRFIQEG